MYEKNDNDPDFFENFTSSNEFYPQVYSQEQSFGRKIRSK